MKKIAIIGAGPAGIFAAINANKDKNNDVHVFDKNEKIGKKLFITGKGRCNVTNSASIDEFINQVVRNPYFMYSSFYSFTNTQVMELMEDYGLKLKEERGGRMFPVSDKSSDVIKVLEKLSKDFNIKLNFNEEIKKVEKVGEEKFLIISEKEVHEFDRVIIATGGNTYMSTGSTGFGYKVAQGFRHNIINPIPALVPMIIKDDFISELEGTSLRNVELVVKIKNKEKYREFGEMLFTKNGISGPIVLTLSSFIGRIPKKDIKLFIDFKPALDFDRLDKRILRDFSENSNRDIINSLDELLIKKSIPLILEKAGIEERKKVHQISKEERVRLVETIKNFELKYDGLQEINRGIITNGGVDVNEVDPSTMESKLVKGLYFAGEVLDIDALTGGYNLQIAYSTGYLAGINAGGE